MKIQGNDLATISGLSLTKYIYIYIYILRSLLAVGALQMVSPKFVQQLVTAHARSQAVGSVVQPV